MPRDRDLEAARHSVDLRAGAQHDLSVARARLGRSARRARHRHRRQRARLLRLSRLPAGVHRARSSAGRVWRRAPASRARASACTRRSSTLSKADIIRRGLELGLDYGLTHSCYDPVARRAALRRVRQLRAARQGLPRSGRPRPGPPGLKSRELLAHPQRPADSAPGRRDHVRAARAVHRWPRRGPPTGRGSSTRTELRDAGRVGRGTAGAYLNKYLDRPRLDGVRARAASRGDGARQAPVRSAVRAVLRDQPLLLNIVVSDTAGIVDGHRACRRTRERLVAGGDAVRHRGRPNRASRRSAS